jgi:hypothetical protein
VATAENTSDVVKKIVNHLSQYHDLNMPSASEILWAEEVPKETSRAEKRAVVEEAQTAAHKTDEGVQLVVKRLMELLKPFEDFKNPKKE